MEQRDKVTGKTSGWEARLFEQIEAARGRPFSWGEHDCLTWAADVMARLTETPTPAGDWRGRYRTGIGAGRLLRRLGYESCAAAVCAHLGPPLASPAFAQRGDLVEGPGGEIGICIGFEAAFIGPDGLYGRPITECSAAWRV